MKEWFQKNPWLGRFLIVAGAATLLALILIFMAKSSYDTAAARFNDAAMERARLQRLDPFPSDENYKKMKVYVQAYGDALEKFKAELKTHVLPAPAELAPNEFQSRLRQAITATTDKARASKVRLPENFFLGFDEFTAALPNTAAAPLLGQELSQIQSLMDTVIDARVDSVTELKRTSLPEESGGAATPASAPGRKPPTANPKGPRTLERAVVDLTFTAVPSAARKAINQIASVNEQIYIIRTLHVRNEKDKGPPREKTTEPAPAANQPAAAKPSGALNFIVGNEHLQVTAKIEIVRFTY